MATADVTWMRQVLNERVPKDQTEEDTNFTDEELQGLLTSESNKYYAAAQGWMLKAGKWLDGTIQSIRAGDEQTVFVDPAKAYDSCVKMSEHYKRLGGGGSRMMVIVDETTEPAPTNDFSRMLGEKFSAEGF